MLMSQTMDEVDASQNDATQSDKAELMDAGLLPEHETMELPPESESDAEEASLDEPDPSSSSKSSTMDDSHANDFIDEEIDNINSNTENTHEKQDTDMENQPAHEK